MATAPETYPDLDTYRRKLFAPEDALLEKVMPEAVAEGLPRISVSAEAGKILNLLARSIGARNILEFGALAGYSGIWLARALPAGGRFLTLELDPKHAEVARRNYDRAGLGGCTDVWVGPAAETMARAVERAPFDMVFIDADKVSYPPISSSR